MDEPWSVFLIVGLCGMLFMVYRSYAQFVGQHRSLSEIYELTREMGDASRDGTLPDVLLGRVRELLQAEYATLWLPAQGRYPELLLSAQVNAPGLLDVGNTPQVLRDRPPSPGATVVVGAQVGRPELRALVKDSGSRTRSWSHSGPGSAVIGLLEVTGRLGDRCPSSGWRMCGCWRRWPRRRRSRSRTRAWSTGCGSTRTTTR